jgi:hypothetical protein
MAGKRRSVSRTRPPDWLLVRVRGEYFEMPGLRVTPSQACRLWQVDAETCERLLDHLVRENFLSKTASGFYIASHGTRWAH